MSNCNDMRRQLSGGRSISILLGALILGLPIRDAHCDDVFKELSGRGISASDDEESGTSDSTDERVTTKSPELVYLTWQRSTNANGKRALNQLWNVSGEIVPFEKAKLAILGTDSLNVHWWNPEESLRPLVLVYRVDPHFASSVITTAIDDRGRRHSMGTFAAGKTRGWSVSAVAPSKDDLAAWPKQITLEIKFPIEKPQLLKTIEKPPVAGVQVADGIEWLVEDQRGLRNRTPAAVVRCEHGKGDWELHSYEIKCYVRGTKQPLEEEYATRLDDAEKEKSFDLRVSTSIEDRRNIEKIEIWRQRNEIKKIHSVPLRLDLQPTADPSREE